MLRSANPYLAFARAIECFHAPPAQPPGVHPAAVIDPPARLGADVRVGPNAVIEAEVVIGDRTRVGPNVTIQTGTRVGAGCLIHAGVVIRDVAHIVPPALKDLIIKRAEEAKIPYQPHVMDLGSTDASAIQYAGSGVPSAVINLPQMRDGGAEVYGWVVNLVAALHEVGFSFGKPR